MKNLSTISLKGTELNLTLEAVRGGGGGDQRKALKGVAHCRDRADGPSTYPVRGMRLGVWQTKAEDGECRTGWDTWKGQQDKVEEWKVSERTY